MQDVDTVSEGEAAWAAARALGLVDTWGSVLLAIANKVVVSPFRATAGMIVGPAVEGSTSKMWNKTHHRDRLGRHCFGSIRNIPR